MKKLLVVLSLLLLPACSTIDKAKQDLRDPEVRAKVEQLLKDIAKLNKEDPVEAPPTVFDKGVPNVQEGMTEEQCEEEHGALDPALKEKVQGRTPVMMDKDLGLLAYAERIDGAPDWYDKVKILECNIERPTPKEDVLGWGWVPMNGHNVYVIFYDNNKDGKVDATIEIWHGEEYPTFYMFDRTYNGSPNIVYMDTDRESGLCTKIQVFAAKEDVKRPIDPREQAYAQ